MEKNITFCPACNKKVKYTIKKHMLKEYKNVIVNVIENIGICSVCNNDIFIMELESANIKRLYKKYEEITGKSIINKKKT